MQGKAADVTVDEVFDEMPDTPDNLVDTVNMLLKYY
jgi:hypothetical protein